jgi:hypothetical protein
MHVTDIASHSLPNVTYQFSRDVRLMNEILTNRNDFKETTKYRFVSEYILCLNLFNPAVTEREFLTPLVTVVSRFHPPP